jgi:hypothetical protein
MPRRKRLIAQGWSRDKEPLATGILERLLCRLLRSPACFYSWDAITGNKIGASGGTTNAEYAAGANPPHHDARA